MAIMPYLDEGLAMFANCSYLLVLDASVAQ